MNLALLQPAYQSSTYSGSGFPRVAALAVDGNHDTNAYNRHCSATNDGAGGANWWVVDLGLTFFIDRVVVVNRDSYGQLYMLLRLLALYRFLSRHSGVYSMQWALWSNYTRILKVVELEFEVRRFETEVSSEWSLVRMDPRVGSGRVTISCIEINQFW